MIVVWILLSICLMSGLPSLAQQGFPGMPFVAPPIGQYGKWGFGSCPKVTTMKNFDVTKLYGKWYLIAHYADAHLYDRHCTHVGISDANPGTDICRVLINRTSVEYDGTVKALQYPALIPNVSDASIMINTYHIPDKTYALDTDYENYHFSHECTQYPRDNPFLYEINNYIMSRKPVWPDGLESFQNGLRLYESFGMDTRLFVLHNQQDCNVD